MLISEILECVQWFTMRGLLCLVIVLITGVFLVGQTSSVGELKDPVTLLAKQIERGDQELNFASDGWGYLSALLKRLNINIDSQVLAFSKTSFQLTKIGPKTPRAIYFSDNVAVGSVQEGSVFEIISFDGSQGLVYYTLETQKAEKPRFERHFAECLNCHGPANGLVVSSVYPSADRTPFVTGTFFEGIDHRTPLENRWGGWYVSGNHGSVRHMGNAVAPDPDHPLDLEEDDTQNLTSLATKFDTTRYLTSTSDIVALLTLEHQVRMTNLFNSLGRQFRRVSNSGSPENARKDLDRAVEQVVEYMLFVDEAPLREPVKGVSTFTNTFPLRGPRDKRGRSLRDFDLQKRLFRYPLSYMIYSEVFDAMPAAAHDRVYQRLRDILSGSDPSPKFGHLSLADRQAIAEILQDTKPGLR